MNIERVNHAIEIMRKAERLNMSSFQGVGFRGKLAPDIETLHTCGNTACFAGYMGISPEYRNWGGVIDGDGAPTHPSLCLRASDVLSDFFEVGHQGRMFLSDLIYGGGPQMDKTLKHKFGTQLEWEDLEPKHVIYLLEQWRDGHIYAEEE